MAGSVPAYVRALISRAWRETRAVFFQKTLKVIVKDIILIVGAVTLTYALQGRLIEAGLVPATTDLAMNRILPIAFALAVLIAAYAAYFLIELLATSPYRLWSDREPPPAAAVMDDETRRLAGVVAALRDRVLIRGFKTPVTYDDPYWGWLEDVSNSTHPIWIKDAPRTARIDFVQSSKTLDVSAPSALACQRAFAWRCGRRLGLALRPRVETPPTA